jgi:hypothetical protein
MIHEVLKELGPKNLNWIYGQSSHTRHGHQQPMDVIQKYARDLVRGIN